MARPAGAGEPTPRAWSVQLHVHSSYSEGVGSIDSHSHEATDVGADATRSTTANNGTSTSPICRKRKAPPSACAGILGRKSPQPGSKAGAEAAWTWEDMAGIMAGGNQLSVIG